MKRIVFFTLLATIISLTGRSQKASITPSVGSLSEDNAAVIVSSSSDSNTKHPSGDSVVDYIPTAGDYNGETIFFDQLFGQYGNSAVTSTLKNKESDNGPTCVEDYQTSINGYDIRIFSLHSEKNQGKIILYGTSSRKRIAEVPMTQGDDTTTVKTYGTGYEQSQLGYGDTYCYVGCIEKLKSILDIISSNGNSGDICPLDQSSIKHVHPDTTQTANVEQSTMSPDAFDTSQDTFDLRGFISSYNSPFQITWSIDSEGRRYEVNIILNDWRISIMYANNFIGGALGQTKIYNTGTSREVAEIDFDNIGTRHVVVDDDGNTLFEENLLFLKATPHN